MEKATVEQKAVVNLEIKKGERTYVFTMPIGSPFGEAYDAAFNVLNEILEMSKKAADQAKPAEMDQAEFQEAIDKANQE